MFVAAPAFQILASSVFRPGISNIFSCQVMLQGLFKLVFEPILSLVIVIQVVPLRDILPTA